MDHPRRAIRNALLAMAGMVCVCVLSCTKSVAAETVPVSRRSVDLVAVKDGPQLLGAILSRDKAGAMTIAVQREWLKANAKTFYETTVAAEQQEMRDVPRKQLERIRAWIKERADSKNILPLLQAELKLSEQRAAKPQPATASHSQFMVVTIPADQIRSGFQQPATHRQIALRAWRERLKDIEIRSAASLSKELREVGKVFDGQPVDLSDRLPQTILETEQQWAARKAIVEFDALKRVRFQGTAAMLVRAGGDHAKDPDIASIFSGIYKSQLDDLLQEALGNGRVMRQSKAKQWDDAVQKAAKTADAEKVLGFRITRVQPDLTANRITVEEHFVAKIPGSGWVTVWMHRETIDATKKRPDIERRIKEDDRVKQALQLVKALGLGADDAQIDRAIRFGAATQIAQEAADDKFSAFRNKYSRKLDEPPIRWKE